MSRRHDRREFLKLMSGLLAAGGMQAFLPQWRLVGQALAQSSGGDYRALVCVYLAGGNDAFNWLVPREPAAYETYRQTRGGVYHPQSNPTGLAIARDELLPLSPVGGGDFGLHPACPELRGLFQQGRLAFVANVGALIVPTTKAQYLNRSVPLPPELFSHNSQTSFWQLGHGDLRHAFGWGGELAARLPTGALPGRLSPCISIAGHTRFLMGPQLAPYQMGTSGAVTLSTGLPSGTPNASAVRARRDQAVAELLALEYAHLFEREYQGTLRRAVALYQQINDALNADPPLATVFPADNPLADQLKMVARMIRASRRPEIGHRRQIYFVSLGGFDTHDAQMVPSGQPRLLGRLSAALGAFQQALVEIGAEQQVVTFTMSEFARTLATNGNGTDHAWGTVQAVLGGPVLGGRVYGTYPTLDNDGEWTLSRGRVIPTLAVEQMASTLARWMGLAPSQLGAIFPNLRNFSPQSLPFLPS
ncbi:MAG: DUF1501 domain-containing protein [Xanthomonadales bacterium]|nr:DUF1501 domain-containing protein [Xanthomonadales bacterium]